MALIVGICLQIFFFRNVMCILGVLEPNIITIRLSITAVNQLTHNNLKMTYR